MATPNSPRNGGSGWRGRAEDESAQIQHRWQSADTHAPTEQVPVDGRGRRFAFAGLLLVALVLLGFYVRSLLLAPVQTPVLLLTAGPYSEPFAPNGWAREDARGLDDLHGETLSVSPPAAGIAEFEARLKESLGRQQQANVVIIVVSMHGAVNDRGEPCLVPPTASAMQSSTWVPFSRVLKSIRDSGIPEKTRKLLVLDCNRVRTWWPQGTLENGFADRLVKSDVLKKAGVPNLYVLNSVSPGERGWASPELRGSVFGHFFRMGIAGKDEADANNDRSVSLQELYAYVRDNVNRWVRGHHGERQQPMLLSGETGESATNADFHVAWAYRGRLPDPKPWVPAVKAEDVGALWRYHDQARADATYRFDPLTWSRFQRKLLRLEAANSAGEAYTSAATTLYNDLLGLKGRLEAQRAAIRNEKSLYASFKTFTNDTEGSVQAKDLPDFALLQLLGGIDAQSADRVRTALETLQTTPTADGIAEAELTLDTTPPARNLADAHFLRMLNRYQVDKLWKKRAVLAGVLRLRSLASRAAVPADVRAFHAIQQSVAETDKRRRLVEDGLFAGEASAVSRIGNPSPPANLATEIDAIADAYDRDLKRAASLQTALRLRDRVHAELPWLLAWLSHPATAWSKDLKRDELESLVKDLLDNFRLFRHALRTGGAYEALRLKVDSQFNDLHAKYVTECERLARSRKVDVSALRQIQAALSIPLVPGGQVRAALNEAARDMAGEIHRNYESGSTAAETPSASQSPALRWRSHPLLALLTDVNPADGERAEAASSDHVYAVEAAIRGQLAALRNDVVQLSAQQTDDPKTFRRTSAWAAERWRVALSLPLSPSERDPVHFLRRFDLQQMLVWQADRTLYDFWGNLGSKTKPPFFATAAGRELEAAQSVFAHFRGFGTKQKSIAGAVDLWKNVPIFTTAANSGLKIDPSDNVSVNVSVRQNRGVSFADGDATVGIAGVSIWGPENRIGTAVKKVDVVRMDADPAGKRNVAKLVFSVNPALAMSAGGALQARTIFRGHESAIPFEPAVAAGVTSEVRPELSNRSKVTVRGSAARPLSIVFILDCSYSMGKLVKQDGSRKTRHQVAVAALRSMLGKLAGRGSARVGVVFYGHRVAWNASKPAELLRQTDYARRFPDELLPLEDVEAVLPLGRFDDRVSKRVERLLETVKPWGETPLYLAIDEALRQFAGETGDGERRIVVITDGVNNQRVPRDLQLTKSQAAKVTSRADLERAIRRRPVPIHILGFEMDSAEERGAQQDFRSIADQSKGSYLAAVAADSLLSSLTGLLGAAEFQLIGADNKPIGKADLGKTITLTVPGTGAAKMAVASGNARADIELSGGESLELAIGGDGTSMESVRYVLRDPVFVPLVDPMTSASSGTLVGVHTASRAGDDSGDVEFLVSLQRTDRGFSPRLPLVWIEVTPLTAPNSPGGKPYLFVDTAYASQTPVPVLRLLAVKWPTTARQASIRVWCRPQPAASESVALSRLLSGAAKVPAPGKAATGPYQIAGSLLRADMHTEKGRLVLRVVQWKETGAAAFEPLKIDVAGVPPGRIVRQFDTDHGIALHRFEFDADKEPLVRSADLRITRRDAALRGAWETAKPTTIAVQAKGELLRLTVPPLGTRN
jgi:hypothetical protein